MLPQPRALRRRSGIYAPERALQHMGLGPVAGIDEAGRGACAGPLVVASVVLPAGRKGAIPGLADSKLLTPRRREAVYEQVMARSSDVSVVVIPPREVDRRGVHAANLEGMRRALARLTARPGYVLTDGFPVPGLHSPSLSVWRGDRVVACVAAASVVAKVTRDRIMVDMDERLRGYGFAVHKGYSTREHMAALEELGPTAEHRLSFANVARLRGPEAAIEHGDADGMDEDRRGLFPESMMEVG